MGQKLSVVGKSLPLKEAWDKVTGKAQYSTTMNLPGMLVGKILRSPHAHARIVSIDISKARALPGVKAVVTANDFPKKLFTVNVMHWQLDGGELMDMYLFADVARYIGDPIAAVAAVNEEIAKEALALIHVEYEVLPAVFTVEDAVKEGAPQIRDNAAGNIVVPPMSVFPTGDMEQGFKEADVVVEGTYTTSKAIQAGMENACSIASYNSGTGRLTVWSQTQLPHMARRMIAHLFDMDEGRVRIIQPYAGNGFGAGTDLNCEPQCCALAIKACAPVKIMYDRAEDFSNRLTREHICKIEMKIGAKQDGTPTALKAKYTGDAGAYMAKTASGAGVALASNITCYEIPNIYQEIEVVYTNHVACGAFRGFGGMQSTFVRETLVDEICQKVGMDPVEFRMKFHRKVGGLGWFPGTKITSCALDKCLEIGAEKIGWKEKRARKKEGIRRKGVGVACMGWLSGAQPMLLELSNALLKFNEDGSCNMIVTPGNIGQGCLGSLSQIAAEVLGLNYEDIHPISYDTDLTEWSVGTHASRGLYCLGLAVKKAAENAREQFLRRAANILKVAPVELAMGGKRIYVAADPQKGISVADVAKDAIYNYSGNSEQITARASITPTAFAPPWQAGFVDLEVDMETGQVSIIKWITVHDIGKAINPMTVEGQLDGGTGQGIGFALYEDTIISTENGKMVADGFDKYKIPSILDMPDNESLLVEEEDPTGPFGAKSVGESGIFLQAPAIANAIYDAVGVRIRDVPITPERIMSALKAKGQ
ncbi:xanthine dehydrogenase family protein molybdopterin-binding subunit [Desulfoscipio gibsoniae]|uniref:Aerobic-type carbon monoxide dehydrogenase, large subunit CoxL/CutL-like protein n=1 Tax=Desulfoscipio gibsoniae DSM 7213 TaxID=767817 RepID=R4KM01_9FIRM|nr:molybdopterin cofactor-binding domain-containing protein [Desulfoscipio gibsoniae]AGL00671.1 aerobic-type carbon monoxide dehydrogenase, large subunit CoxL/CutL-like protein [Desulfoscipio gibsoniae DSM 7213]